MQEKKVHTIGQDIVEENDIILKKIKENIEQSKKLTKLIIEESKKSKKNLIVYFILLATVISVIAAMIFS